MKTLKVEPNLIDKLLSIRNELNTHLAEIGKIEIQIDYLKEKKKEVLNSFYQFENKDSDVVNEIVSKYGEGKINFSTGEIELFQ